MNKIATHNSATGEAGRGILSFLVAPFSKCQSKTLKEQYEAGCRYFDIRYKFDGSIYRCAHGLWTSKISLCDVLEWMHKKGDCYCMMTCESGEPMSDDEIDNYIDVFHRVTFTSFNVKHPEWEVVKCNHPTPHINAYKVLNWDSWHTLLPIPWLWKKVYYDKPEFNEETFTMVDFL